MTFDGFGVANVVGLNSATATGTYKLLDGSAAFDFTNVANFGSGNAYDLGGGKSAYFQQGSLELVVIPERVRPSKSGERKPGLFSKAC